MILNCTKWNDSTDILILPLPASLLVENLPNFTKSFGTWQNATPKGWLRPLATGEFTGQSRLLQTRGCHWLHDFTIAKRYSDFVPSKICF